MDTFVMVGYVLLGALVVIGVGYLFAISLFLKKVSQGKALVKTGQGKPRVSTGKSMWVVPLFHKLEMMDISLKQVVITREGKDGLICKDNLRADIKVAFFVRVSPEENDILRVASTIGCTRASDPDQLRVLFEAKFSEALKSVGKRFDFIDLYNSRDELKKEIIQVIGKDLNGYSLDDAAIDYLEQTPVEYLDENNILDAVGIKKIRELTADQITAANKVQREREKEIKRQDTEKAEAFLELEKQLAEKSEVQKREIASIKARETAETQKVQEEERLKADAARIERERQIMIEEENKMRDIIVAKKNKERTEAVEQEKVVRERDLEAVERDRIVSLANIEKEKALEEERKQIQDVIRDRVAVEREVVEEQERIKDTEAIAEAERLKQVAILEAEKRAQEQLVERIKGAEAEKEASQLEAQTRVIQANALRESIDKEAEAKKIMADATAEEHAAIGLAEARVLEAKASAREKEGQAEANVLEQQAIAEAKGIELKGDAQADANEKIGMVDAKLNVEKGLAEAQVLEAKAAATEKMGVAEAKVIEERGIADAKGVAAKAEAMQKLDGVGKEHEEFKLRLEKETAIELARIEIQREIAAAQAQVLAEALKAANIDIVGGEQEFFDRITNAVSNSKYVDRIMDSQHLVDLKQSLLGNGESNGNLGLGKALKGFVGQFGLDSADVKNLTISALIMKMMNQTEDSSQLNLLTNLLNTAKTMGIDHQKAESIGLN
ncbi:flotillin family protein [Pontibacter sp. G13]|uniref:flotillin family protein n=1 Tax=Pontibacter sp. G13 TaxID=3074898 RepID=UPI00288B0C38|nr:flotillin family protein [Pontibacter sp. G13]WNJ19791.1 flotillin family protein [Pontibacter sp. G13]